MKIDPDLIMGQSALDAHLADMRSARTIPMWRWIIRLFLLCLLLTEVSYFWK